MTQCVAYGCTNRVKNKQSAGEAEVKSLSFHRFPKDAELKEKWVRAIRRENWKPSDHSRICSDHFRDSDYDNSSPFRRFLKKDAIPSVFHAFPPHLQPSASTSKTPRRVLKRNLSPVPSPIPEKIPKTDLEITCDELEKTRQKLTETRKKLRNVKLKQKRLKVKVANLKNIVDELKKKNLIQSEHCDLLSNISKTSFCLMQRESQKHINPKMKKMYDERLRNFATTLHFLSPKAYNFVRSTFQTCLPHPRTIAKWYESINAEPGFSSEVFRVLKEKCQNQPGLVCSLMFDAMAIRQHVDWDGKRLYGYMDLGRGNTDDGAPVANEVFVIHLVCINALWKIPLGYFFIKGISGEHIYSLMSQCLQLLSEVNIKVASITCDGTSSNFSSFVRFGCNLKDPYQLQTNFQTKSHHVNVFLDPSHMLKLVRNSLHDLKELTDANGRVISWVYFEKLLHLQETEGLNLGNKIKKQHVYFKNQKMKVKLAAQLLSTSVADALKYCLVKRIPGFEQCEGTIEFIEVFNDLFDVLNSRSIKEKYLKQAINENNEDEIFRTLEKAENYIRTLREKNGKMVLNGSRKTGFIGFLICISSMRTLYDRLVKREKTLKYLPMYKVSQDHLERLFGYIRRRGGTNDNPSAYEFCHTFRKIIVHKQLHESDASSGNAIPLDKIDLLGIGFGRKITCEDSINLSIPKWSMLSQEVPREDDFEEECLELQETVFSDLILDVVEYIAGYVVRALGRKIKCEECLSVIAKDNENSPLNLTVSLVSVKNRGGLIQPSSDVNRICKICEKIFKMTVLENKINPNLDFYTNKLMSHCPNMNFFVDSVHFAIGGEDNHKNWLIESIGKVYFTIRIKKYIRDHNQEIQEQKVRQKLKKLIHFKGQ